MEEDKQIYTSARSEEVKRQILAFKRAVEQRFEKFRKEHREKTKAREAKVKLEVKTPRPQIKTQDIQTIADKKDSYKPLKTESEESLPLKKSLSYTSKETLYETVTYVIFGIIILFIVLGIFLTYVK
jgi:hypothetical protein